MQPPYSPYPHVPFDPPAPRPAAVRRHRTWVAAGAALIAAGTVAGVAVAEQSATTNGIGSVSLPSIDRQGVNGLPGTGSGGSNGTGSSGSGSANSGTATAAQSVGVVDIDTVLGYQGARAAGTGIVLTAAGEVLTNNHVVNGATKIAVTVVSTGRTYTASVVGTDPSDDVAVIQLADASGLSTANLGDSSSVRAGDAVTGVGNAGGVGGTPSAAAGRVLALNQQLTASDTDGANAEHLTGMIEIDAPIAAGDSGGPLYDAAGAVIGIDTAAQTGGRSTATTVAYAIPIDKALGIAGQIESGQASSTVHIGLPGFLGVSVADSSGGALIEQVVPGAPAAQAGLTAGDVVTAVDGTAVTSGSALKPALTGHGPGDRVTLHWTDPAGGTHSATVTLIAGPAD